MAGAVLSTNNASLHKTQSLPSGNLVSCETHRHRSSHHMKNDQSYRGKVTDARRGDIREDFSEEMTLKRRIKIGVSSLKEWRENVSKRRKNLWKIPEAGRCRGGVRDLEGLCG